MGRLAAYAKLMLRGVRFNPRMYYTDDARLNAYDYAFLVKTGVAGLTGITPDHNYFYAQPPTDFDYHVTPPQIASGAPIVPPNPLITPALALSFAQNLVGR